MKLKKLLSFTLIELLVVIAIVGILTGFIIASLNSGTEAAKDAKRKYDIGGLERALLIYGAQNENDYPNTDTYPCTIGGGTTPCTNLATDLLPYLTSLPRDPNNGYYIYSYSDSPEPNFTLTTTLSDSSTYEYNSISGFITINFSSTCAAATNTEVQCSPITINSTEEACRCTYLSGTGTTTWTVPNNITAVEVLLVGGGAGGGVTDREGGGGGAGGLLTGTISSLPASFTITVGKGGASKTPGSNSVLVGNTTFTAVGGGDGGSPYGQVPVGAGYNGAPGGSGGGGGHAGTGGATTQTSQSPLTGYGYAGGSGRNLSPYTGGGGCGAGGIGGTATTIGGTGGTGFQSSITGTSLYYAGGGGGGAQTGTGGAGGSSIGGTGGANSVGYNAVADTGSGGGGGGCNACAGGAGSSGIVILRYTHS